MPSLEIWEWGFKIVACTITCNYERSEPPSVVNGVTVSVFIYIVRDLKETREFGKDHFRKDHLRRDPCAINQSHPAVIDQSHLAVIDQSHPATEDAPGIDPQPGL